uniref:hypothetical protein n=1 Tax=Candidatus Protochlamydia sp. R18 TaxID=1353977 RepID=UPI0005A82677|nr:hypothetical protein [Candidatus Protochlamydia sp. R18]
MQITEFEKFLNYFSNEIKGLNFLKNTYLIDTYFLALKNYKNLKVFYLQGYPKLTDAGLAHLAPLVALEHLDLSGCTNLTDDELANFKFQ